VQVTLSGGGNPPNTEGIWMAQYAP
jgi:hypothetical protein